MSASTLPLILCGKKPEIVGPVIEALKPEYEAIDVIHTYEDAQAHLEGLLKGKTAAEGQSISSPSLGSHDYGRSPVAVVIGGGFSDEEAMQILALSRSIRRVPYFRVSGPPAGAPPVIPGPEYGIKVAARMKACLDERKAQGGLEGADLAHEAEDVTWV